MLYLAERARKLTGKTRLCISGGVALNSVANFVISKSGLFEQVFINPAASDTGIPLGAALYGYHTIYGRDRLTVPISPYIGPRHTPESVANAIQPALARCSVERERVLERTADLLADNRIVAHFHGRSEMGPRALGNRSILMSPMRAENKDVLNARVKHREAFRPFAPACLLEHTAEFSRSMFHVLTCCWCHPFERTSDTSFPRLLTLTELADCKPSVNSIIRASGD